MYYFTQYCYIFFMRISFVQLSYQHANIKRF